jgi:hypothetical protein
MFGGSGRSHGFGMEESEAPRDAQYLIQMHEIRLLSQLSLGIRTSARNDSHAGCWRIEDRTMVTVEEFSRLVSGVYAAAVTPKHWAAALADISRMLNASGGGLLTGVGSSRSVMTTTVPSEASSAYIAYYRTIDYVLDAVEKSPVGLIRGGQQLVALNAHSEFEADFMRPFEMDDGIFVRLTGGRLPTSFLVAAPKGPEPFDTAERVKFMGALIPHLQQAVRTQAGRRAGGRPARSNHRRSRTFGDKPEFGRRADRSRGRRAALGVRTHRRDKHACRTGAALRHTERHRRRTVRCQGSAIAHLCSAFG